MKGVKHPKNDLTVNPSGNESIFDVIGRVEVSRRRFIQGSAGAGMLAAAGGLTLSGVVNAMEGVGLHRHDSHRVVGINFDGIPPSLALDGVKNVADEVRVPEGYTARVLVAWGDPIARGGVAYKADASNTAAEQAKQYGMHTDGMHFFPFANRGYGDYQASDRGILCANNEYTHEEVLFADGQVGAGYTIEKCRKSQAAHGVSILETRRSNGKWQVVANSIYGRRITSNTPMRISGPAAGHALMKTNEYDIKDSGSVATGKTTNGTTARGTINNCANGITPWGTYLTCEENWNGNFGANAALPATTTEAGKLYNRYGVTAAGFGYRWHTVDPRFDLAVNPNETNHFGWIVEIDPFDPKSVPVKRTAMGRFKHESAQYVVDADDQVAFYMGDDERNEYIYKFVCDKKLARRNHRANRDMLDKGTLYVARFDADLTGTWIPLQPDTLGVDGVALRDNPNFTGADDAEVMAKILIKTRMAADAVGATMMDRPEWTGARPRLNGFNEVEVYCTLTNNNRRGSSATPSSNKADGSTTAASARPAVDAANPREDNIYGHIIRWREDGKSVLAISFTWDIFAQAGDVSTTKTAKPTNDYKGDIVDSPDASCDFGAPDGLWFDWFGRLWVQTDQVGDGSGDWIHLGANSLSCADPESKQFRRFLTGPNRCEVTGITMTPDGKTLFVGIQHPGEDSTVANPTQYSNWPASQWPVRADGVTPLPGGRPRSSVVVITKDDGGIIGA